jgi:hypothetical protein
MGLFCGCGANYPPLGTLARVVHHATHHASTYSVTRSVTDNAANKKLGETQDMVIARVRIIINEMQKRVLTKQDLME